ncbi:lytic transglycosylase domain-containing protein [Nitratireductor sp. ZSWI3]|uniref:lytic murein transglycosylase n=1 Tax=Nitratireductor sp. ZSWI3 TaxID=2966359 RepID=UPI00215057BF|nr:lytic transglycosylase domain-containing protein [Nitratireductor sp. ZSWI3]MCR4268692.1 lytic transglycosylase domain-containing protein [Nitratireductor sp. ZSWI3]
MAFGGRAVFLAAAVCASILVAESNAAAQCGTGAGGFEAWKADFSRQAAARGIGRRGLDALAGTRYASKTIAADRGQKSFKLSLNSFMQKRGANAIISRGKGMKKKHAQLFANIERRYGVPAGPLIAIWGMETGFGGYLGNQNIVSAVATLAYDCRRPEFFTGHLYGALEMVDRGMLDPAAKGAAHGEIGQTQFLPGNALKYAVDGDGNGRVDMIRSSADALASTANFLRAHGWRAGGGYQPGEVNFRAIQGWNAASVYQQAIAIIGKEIDG